MPFLDYARVRQQIPMSEVLRLLAFEPTIVRGPQWRGVCPIHERTYEGGANSPQCGTNSSNKVFSVNVQQEIYRCFACGSCGNQLDLWRAVEGTSLYPATLSLCKAAGVEPPWLPTRTSSAKE